MFTVTIEISSSRDLIDNFGTGLGFGAI
ncbi:hypothetical protein PENANT_c005G02766 [Penicillium antarcticum]|uniref:Uncharacterized protein n=1 Tax=Penicillium antarcticum TaxID=416450 RepID=A0A1V6QG25_9EURO|nr:hypothetical protein PENANT_c005G02766 [Penicillium antarcticum]